MLDKDVPPTVLDPGLTPVDFKNVVVASESEKNLALSELENYDVPSKVERGVPSAPQEDGVTLATEEDVTLKVEEGDVTLEPKENTAPSGLEDRVLPPEKSLVLSLSSRETCSPQS